MPTSPMTVGDYFAIQYGQKEYESKRRLKKGTTPLITSAGTDNGFYGFFDIPPKFENVISFPRTGSIGEARVHDYPCCIDNNCLVLTPKTTLSAAQFYYAATVLRSQKWRFRYGRQATELRIADIQLPLMEEIGEMWQAPEIEIATINRRFSEAVKARRA